MYIVNTSFFISPAAHERWLALMRKEYMPLLATEGFGDSRLFRVLSQNPSPEGCTYCLMTRCRDMEGYRRLSGELFDRYKQAAAPLFGDSVQWFTTLLKEIEDNLPEI